MSNGGWERRLYEVNPLALAQQEIFMTYGDTVSAFEKGKTLLKFGRNPGMAQNTKETIWTLGGNETYVPFDGTNPIDTVSSSSTSDTAKTLRVEGHTQSGTGTDTKFSFVIQDVTINGQNKVTLTTPVARLSRAYVVGTDTLVGDVYFYEDTTLTGGVPTDLTKAHLEIEGSAGETQTYKTATTFSDSDYFICTGGFVSVTRAQAGIVDFTLEVRPVGGVFRPVARLSVNSVAQGTVQINLFPYKIVPRNADIRVVGIANTVNIVADAAFQGWIAKVI